MNIRRHAIAPLALASSVLGVQTPVHAQAVETSAVIEGIVVDAATRSPLRGARVVVMKDRGVTTDSAGNFRLANLQAGDHLLLVESYGYESLHVRATAGTDQPRIEIPLEPAPMVLDGLSVEVMARNVETMDQRLRARRNAAATNVQALTQDRLLRSGARDMMELLQFEASLMPQPCDGTRASSGRCILRRGGLLQPRVFIDEAPAIGGLDELATWRPHELYLVEVWSSGSIIRAYTHQFMERMAKRPVQLIYDW